MIPTNKYQTQLTDELLDSLHPEVREQLLDYINGVPFIRNLINPERKYARDLPRRNGKIIVDVTNPHILENMDYFLSTRNYYKEHGVYTNLKPNGNPKSEYGKWIRTELDRIWNGMVRPEDGEWITGDMYYYLNYTPMKQAKVIDGTNIANRVIDFPEVWEGVYLWFHTQYQARYGGLYNDWKGAQHCIEIAKRGASKSYTAASRLARLFVCGESEAVSRDVSALVAAYQKEFLIKDGILNKFVNDIDFAAQNTQFPSSRLKNSLSDMDWKMGYKDLDGSERGTKNEVIGVAVKDDPDKSRGKRCSLLEYEEFGVFPKFIDTWMVNRSSTEEDEYLSGQMVAFGTGGSPGSDFSGALEIIYNPVGYGVYALPNVFDKDNQGKRNTVFFFGSYLNRRGCYDENGVSDVTKALIQELNARYKIKYNSTDPMAVTRKIAEQAITIQEAIMRKDCSIYPISDLYDSINRLDANPVLLDTIYVGRLDLNGSGVVSFVPSSAVSPIREFPHKDNKLEGAVEIHRMPEKDKDGMVYSGRYIAGIDPYDDDASQTLSLGSILILDLWTDRIVAEYTGRPDFADDFYEICRRMLMFYNAKCNYENNKKGLFKYFSQMHSLYLLTDTLEFLRDKDVVKGNLYGNKLKGTTSTSVVKVYARNCIRNWLMSPVSLSESDLKPDENQSEDEMIKMVPMVSCMNSRALMKELAMWNPDGNFDRHDALVMLMLLREDRIRVCGGISPKEMASHRDYGYLGDDPFFKRNYHSLSRVTQEKH